MNQDLMPTPGDLAIQSVKETRLNARLRNAFKEMLAALINKEPSLASIQVKAVIAGFSQGICLPAEAASYALALPGSMQAGKHAFAFFAGTGQRQRCVRLNALSRLLLPLIDAQSWTIDEVLLSFTSWLDRCGPGPFRAVNGDRRQQLQAVELGARSFWRQHLPELLLSDAIGVYSFTPLPPRALSRLASNRPLVRTGTAGSATTRCAILFDSAKALPESILVQQVQAVMTRGGDDNLARLRERQREELVALVEQSEADALAILVIIVAEGICTRGTIRKSRPSHSIASRYVRELVRMFSANPETAGSLVDLELRERAQAYKALVSFASNRVDGWYALLTADLHFCAAFDIEPVLRGRPNESRLCRAPARFLTEAELDRVRELSSQMSSTSALAVVIEAMVQVASRRPVRPGDLRDACVEDVEIFEQRAVLNVRRRRHRKGSKTGFTEGPIEFLEPEVIQALTELKRYREHRAAAPIDPLWGTDLDESRRNYLRACAAVCDCIRTATGDTQESFYSLRHAVFSHAVQRALMLDDPAAAAWELKRASLLGRHASLETTLEHYYHLAMVVTAKHCDRAMLSLLTPVAASAWCGVGERELKRRGKEGWQAALEQAADQVRIDDIGLRHPVSPDALSPPPLGLRLDDLLHSHVLSARCKCSGQGPAVRPVIPKPSLTSWEQALLSARACYLDRWGDAIHIATTRQKKLQGVRKQLSRFATSDQTQAANRLWRSSARRGFLDCTDPEALAGWTHFLRHCGVPASQLILRLDSSQLERLELISETFSSVTGMCPHIEVVPSGKGRPSTYLLIASRSPRPGEVMPSAALSMRGFHGLLLSSCLREDLSDPPLGKNP